MIVNGPSAFQREDQEARLLSPVKSTVSKPHPLFALCNRSTGVTINPLIDIDVASVFFESRR